MADERVVIRIDVDADTSDISRVQAQLATLAGSSEAADRSTSRTSASLDKMDGNSRRLSGSLNDNNDAFGRMNNRLNALAGGSGGGSMGRVNRQMGNMNNNAKRSRRSMRYLMYAVIGVGVEFAIVAGSLSLVNAGFAIGNFGAKMYQGSLALAAGAAAGLTVALAGAAAAQREWQAAMFATTYKSLPNLGSGTQQAMSALRMLTNDSRVAVFGMESLQQAFAAVSKNTEMTAPLKNALVGIGDFAVAAGGDMGKNFAAAGDFIGLLQKEGKLTDNVLSAAGKVGPQFEKAVKDAQKAGISGAPQLLAALSSGKLAEDSGIGGALGAVNNTLIGQLKSFMTQAVSSFADFGQLFLPQLKATFKGISHELNTSFARIQAAIGPTMGGGMITGFGKIASRLIEVLTRFFEDNLPKFEETFNSIYEFMKRTWTFLTSLDDIFAPFREGSRIINQTFGPPIVALLMHFVDAFKQLNKLAIDNEDAFLDFGQMLERTVNFISSAFDLLKEVFTDNLDTITAGMNVLLTVAEAILGVFQGLQKVGKSLGPLGAILSAGLGIGLIGALQGGRNMKLRAGGKAQKGNVLSSMGGFFMGGGGGGGGGGAGFGYGRGAGLGFNARYNASVAAGKLNNSRVMGGAGLLATLPLAGQAPELAMTAGAMGNMGAMFANNQKNALRIAGIATSIPYLATAMQSQTLLGGATTGAMGGAALGAALGSMIPVPGVGPALGAGVGTIAGSTLGGIRGATSQFDLSPQAGLAYGAGAGFLAGGGAGALIGTATIPVPVVGTIVGAVVGAVAGTLIGGITGLVSGIQQDREQRGAIRKGYREVGLEQGKTLAGDYLRDGLPGVKRSIATIRDATTKIDEIAGSYREKTLQERKEMANAAILRGDITQEEYNVLTLRNMDTGITQLKKNSEELENQGLKAFANIDDNLRKLSETTGMSEEALIKLSSEMGLDLTDNTLQMATAVAKLGLAIPETTEQIRASIKRLALNAISEVTRPIIETEQAILAMDQAAEEIRGSGGFSGGRVQMAKFLDTVATGTLAAMENPIDALVNLEQGFLGREGLAYTTPGSSLFGMFDQLGPEFQAMVQKALGNAQGDVFGDYSGRLATGLTGLPGNNFQFAASDFDGFFTGIAEKLPTGLGTKFAGQFSEGLLEKVGSDDFRTGFANLKTPEERTAATAKAMQDVLKELTGPEGPFAGLVDPNILNTPVEVPGIGTVVSTLGPLAGSFDRAAQRIADQTATMRTAVGTGVMDAFATMKPEWWGKPPWWDPPGGDTSYPKNRLFPSGPSGGSGTGPGKTGQYPGGTPERYGMTLTDDSNDTTSSRLARTMMSHSQLNSQLPGKRSITSSWRNTGLGSLNSDHVTGHAYDLVGQNLVGYSALVNSSGGFAEFHGSGGDRHLHVVPGAAPYGDAVSPMGSTGASDSASYNSNYSIVVNASPNQDVSAIANEVMNRIEDKERQIRERS